MRPGRVRDAILAHLSERGTDGARVSDIYAAVVELTGEDVPASSVRSYLNLNTPTMFVRVRHGHYRLAEGVHV